jgi:nitrogen regulatory protein PII
MEMIVADSRARQVAEVIMTTARSGKIGDGKIFISTVDEAIRIRSGEEGDSIL